MLTRLAFLLIFAVVFSLHSAQAAEADHSGDSQNELSLSDVTAITIQPAIVDGVDSEIVQIPNEKPFVIPVMLPPSSKDLTAEEIAEAREASRAMTAVALQAILAGDFNGAIRLDEQTILQRLFAYNHDAYKPIPKDLPAHQKIGRVVKMVWQFVIVETLHALNDYRKDWWKVAPRFREFGFTIDFKIETQLFLAKFNPTARLLRKLDPERKLKHASHSHAVYFGIAYSFKQHRLWLKKNYRREKGSGGFGAPALKAEIRMFQSDGYKGPIHGVSLYPISPPIVSLIFDKSEHYFSQGLTVGLNGGDLVPFSTLTNTFTNYVQIDHDYSPSDVPHEAYAAVVKAAHFVTSYHDELTCSSLFSK